MSCFPCFGSKESEEEVPAEVPVAQVIDAPATPPAGKVKDPPDSSTDVTKNDANATENNNSRTFTFRELLMATKNFKHETLIGEEGFGKLYKGKLQCGEVVSVKHLDKNGTQGNKEFLVEVSILTLLNHPNLVKLIGYCADGDQRLLVYEFMSFGSLDYHLHDISDDKKILDWQTRMKIASGVAQGLEYLHEKANPPVFYGELKPANIWLNEDYNPRLSGYGLAKLANGDTKTLASSRVMGTNGYCAPEYERQGELNAKSDVYSFGVILLELITGRRALDTTRSTDEQNLVCWAQPMFRDQKKFPEMADPVLEGRFPQKSLNQAIGMAAMCLQEEPSVRPLMGDVVSMLSFLEVAPPPPDEPIPTSLQAPPPPEASRNDDDKRSESSDSESDYSSDSSENNDTSSQHKIDAKSKRKDSNKSCNSISSTDSSKSFDENVFLDESDDNDNESEVKNSKTELSMNNASSDAPQGHESVNLRKNSIIDGSQAGSIGSSSSSFVWSIGSSSDHQLHDGSSARRSNSGHISNVEFDNDIHSLNLRQQSIPNA